MCRDYCCREDGPGVPKQEYEEILGATDYYTDVSRSPNCDWDMFQECRDQYQIDWNYYKRYECVQKSGCVSWTTFSLHDS